MQEISSKSRREQRITRKLPMHRRVQKITRNLIIDLTYGGFLGKTVKSRYPHLGAFNTSATDYAVLSQIFKGLIKPTDVLVDVGCGRARVILWWLRHGYKNKIYGIELDKEVTQYARRKTKKFKNVTIIEGNVLNNIPEDGTIFYLFNPFDERLMKQFRDYLFSSKRNVLLVYYNCVHLHLFKNSSYWQVEERSLKHIPTRAGDYALIHSAYDTVVTKKPGQDPVTSN